MLKHKMNEIYSLMLNKNTTLLFGLIFILSAILIFEWSSSTKEIATIDITALTSNFIQEIKSQKLSHEELKNQITAFGTHLEKEIQVFAADNQLILLPKEAVIAGVPDYTDYLSFKLKNGMKQ